MTAKPNVTAASQLDTARYLAGAQHTKVVVLTGADRPELHKESDAAFNLGCAVGALSSLTLPGVYVAMGGLVLPPHLVRAAMWNLANRNYWGLTEN
jgi:L-asparaginase